MFFVNTCSPVQNFMCCGIEIIVLRITMYNSYGRDFIGKATDVGQAIFNSENV